LNFRQKTMVKLPNIFVPKKELQNI